MLTASGIRDGPGATSKRDEDGGDASDGGASDGDASDQDGVAAASARAVPFP
jgi:hypothetical protein